VWTIQLLASTASLAQGWSLGHPSSQWHQCCSSIWMSGTPSEHQSLLSWSSLTKWHTRQQTSATSECSTCSHSLGLSCHLDSSHHQFQWWTCQCLLGQLQACSSKLCMKRTLECSRSLRHQLSLTSSRLLDTARLSSLLLELEETSLGTGNESSAQLLSRESLSTCTTAAWSKLELQMSSEQSSTMGHLASLPIPKWWCLWRS